MCSLRDFQGSFGLGTFLTFFFFFFHFSPFTLTFGQVPGKDGMPEQLYLAVEFTV